VPADLSAVESIPRTYVKCSGDPGDPPPAVSSPGFDLVELRAGHWPMVTRPAETAELIDKLARD
jgi:hypothetical protein